MAKKKKTLEELLGEALVKEEEQPYEVPDNWVWVKFEETIDNLTNSKKKLKKKYYQKNGKFRVIDQSEEYIGGYTDRNDLLYLGELPIIIFGDHTRCVKYVDTPFVQGADGVKVLRSKGDYLFNKFLYYSLNNLELPNKGYSRHYKYLKESKIPLPPLKEQKRIVNKMESMFNKLDEAKELIEEAREEFENRKSAILAKAFRGELTERWREGNLVITEKNKNQDSIVDESFNTSHNFYEIPKQWEWVKLSELFYTVKDRIKPTEEKIYFYIGLEHMKKTGGIKEIGTSEGIKSTKTMFKKNDILYGRLRPYLEKHSIIDFDGICSTDILVFRNKDKYLSVLLDYYLGTSFVTRYAMENSNGINLPRVSIKAMNDLPIPLPPLQEQKEIVRILDKLLERESQIKELTELEDEIELIKKSILAKAFRGQLGTNDPNDENAIELLKEVLKEKVKK